MADADAPPDRRVIDVYQRHGAAWAELRGDHLTEAGWLDRFCALLGPDATVLDIGCGSGRPIAGELLRRGVEVSGLDGTPTMLALFRRNFPGVAAHLMDMRQMDLGRRFSGLLAWDSFFHLSPDDQRGMFARFEAHAAPGAPLMFTSGDHEGEAFGCLEGDALYHGSLDADEYRDRLAASGFDVVAWVSRDASCGHRTVWLSRQRCCR